MPLPPTAGIVGIPDDDSHGLRSRSVSATTYRTSPMRGIPPSASGRRPALYGAGAPVVASRRSHRPPRSPLAVMGNPPARRHHGDGHLAPGPPRPATP